MITGDSQHALIGEEKHLQGDLDRDESPEDLGPAHEADGPFESPDLACVLLLHLGREQIGPKLEGVEDAEAMVRDPCKAANAAEDETHGTLLAK